MTSTLSAIKDACEWTHRFLATIHKPFIALCLFDFCVSSVKEYRLGTLKCHDHDILKLHQVIRLQHFGEVKRTPLLRLL